MIWKPSKRFGIGKATSREDGMFCTYIVALYTEKGNNRDEYASNVLKGDFDFGYCDSLGKQHRQTFRRYQRERVENSSTSKSLSRKNSTTSRTHRVATTRDNKGVSKNSITDNKLELEKSFFPNNSNKTVLVTKTNVSTSVDSLRKRNGSKDETDMTESVLRPEDIVLSIKKIDRSVSNTNKKNLNTQRKSTPIVNTYSNNRSAPDKKTKDNNKPILSLPTAATRKSLKRENKSSKTKVSNLRKGKKIIVDNLMQLNDFVLKVTEKTKKYHNKKRPPALPTRKKIKKTNEKTRGAVNR